MTTTQDPALAAWLDAAGEEGRPIRELIFAMLDNLDATPETITQTVLALIEIVDHLGRMEEVNRRQRNRMARAMYRAADGMVGP